MNLNVCWRDATFVGFDTETTGKYPFDAELCEVAAVKWQGGRIIDEFQSLVKPTRPMGDEVIKIHNITNEMVSTAPDVASVITEFHKFVGESFLVAHHAPFDLGFIAIELEKCQLPLPKAPVLCSSLIARRAITTTHNHRLQTLVRHLKLPQGQAHRALDDARACLQVALHCFEKVGSQATLKEIIQFQEKVLRWEHYSQMGLTTHAVYKKLIAAVKNKAPVQIVYLGGSRPGQPRTVNPIGLVRNPNGDFLVAADDEKARVPKRYFLNKITKVRE